MYHGHSRGVNAHSNHLALDFRICFIPEPQCGKVATKVEREILQRKNPKHIAIDFYASWSKRFSYKPREDR
jgi:hypothetical protein